MQGPACKGNRANQEISMLTILSCCGMYRRVDHRTVQFTSSTERPAGPAAAAAATGAAPKNPFAGQSQAALPMLAAVAEGGSGSEASPTDSPAGQAGHASVPKAAPEIAAEERLVGGTLIQSLEILQRLCSSPDGQRLAHARVGQLGRHQVSAILQQRCLTAKST